MPNTIKLNCRNLFTYFLFHTSDKRLSARDQKTAKLVSILFRGSVLGYAICRLFLYKKIPQNTPNKITEVSGKHLSFSLKKNSSQAQDSHAQESSHVTEKHSQQQGKLSQQEDASDTLSKQNSQAEKHSQVEEELPEPKATSIKKSKSSSHSAEQEEELLQPEEKAASIKLSKSSSHSAEQEEELLQEEETAVSGKKSKSSSHSAEQEEELLQQEEKAASIKKSKSSSHSAERHSQHEEEASSELSHSNPHLSNHEEEQELNEPSSSQSSGKVSVDSEESLSTPDSLSAEEEADEPLSYLPNGSRSSCSFNLKELMDMPRSCSPMPLNAEDVQGEDIFAQVVDNWASQGFFQGARLIDWPFLKGKKLQVISRESVVIEKLDALVNQRIAQFEEAISFSERVLLLHERDHLKYLTMRDLELSLSESNIIHALMSKEDLGKIVLQKEPSPKRLKMIKHRLPTLDKIAVKTLPEDCTKLTLQELHSLTGSQLSTIIDKLPKYACTLLSDEQIQEMKCSQMNGAAIPSPLPASGKSSKTDLLSDDQVASFDFKVFKDTVEDREKLKLLLSSKCTNGKARMKLLNMNQLSSCWALLDNDLLSLISKNQIAQMNAGFSLNVDKFNVLFPKKKGEEAWKKSKIQYLKSSTIIMYWSFFDATRITYLSHDQVKSLNFVLFDSPKGKELFAALFDPTEPRAKERFQQLSDKQKEYVKGHIDKKKFQQLSEKQKKNVKKIVIKKLGKFNKKVGKYA